MKDTQKDEIVQFVKNLKNTAFSEIDEKKLLAMTDAEYLTALIDHLRANFEACAECKSKKCVFRLTIPVWDFLNFKRTQKKQ